MLIPNGARLCDINTIRQSFGTIQSIHFGSRSGTSLGFEDGEDSAFRLHLDDTNLNECSGFRDTAVAANQTAVVGDLDVFGRSKYGELGMREDVGSGSQHGLILLKLSGIGHNAKTFETKGDMDKGNQLMNMFGDTPIDGIHDAKYKIDGYMNS